MLRNDTLLTNCVESPWNCVRFVGFEGAIFSNNILGTPNFKHIEKMFVFMNMFSMRWKIGIARCCLKKLSSFKHNKTGALLW